jgi:hypothetical protein
MTTAKKESLPIPELGGKTWEELEVVTHDDGHLLFKDKIRKRNAKGGWDAVPVRVRIVRSLEITRARGETRVLFKQIEGLDEDKDKDQFEALEQICVLSKAIRTEKAPYGQLATTEELATDYDEGSLMDVSARIQVLRTMLDPREAELTRDTIWGTIRAVAERGNLFPLADIAGHEHPSFIVFMAAQALKSPMGVAWLQSQESSTLAPSNATSSSESSLEPIG